MLYLSRISTNSQGIEVAEDVTTVPNETVGLAFLEVLNHNAKLGLTKGNKYALTEAI